MNFRKKIFILSFVAVFLFAYRASAATIFLLPEGRSFGIGQEFSVDIKVNTEDSSINAAQAIVQFPQNILELLSADKAGSALNFWVEEPKISNEEGTLNFTGGTAKGISGGSLQILKMKFKAKGVGFAELAIRDAAVTASDGKGTNVLSTIKGTTITVGTTTVLPTKSPTPSPLSPIEEPKKVIREPVRAKNSPKAPELRVPSYPDQSRWYNRAGEAAVFWNVPSDIIDAATILNKSPLTQLKKPESELFTGKNFGILKEGVWYVHVRFRNNIGWGDSAHYKISLDTTTPAPFKIKIDNAASDNPSPEIRYATIDSFSGIAEYQIFIDGKGPLKTASTTMVLQPQPPGKHTIVVRALDMAGNSVEDNLAFEILPLATPTIDFITQNISLGESVFVSGASIPNAFVDIKIVNSIGREIFKKAAASDANGKWELIVKEPLDQGKYMVSATSRDERGAQSFPTEGYSVRIKPKVIISLGFVDLGWFEIFLIAVLLAASIGGVGAWQFARRRQIRGAYGVILARDIEKLCTMLEDQIKEVEPLKESHDPRLSAQASFMFTKIEDTIARMKKYLKQEAERLK